MESIEKWFDLMTMVMMFNDDDDVAVYWMTIKTNGFRH